MFNEVELSPKRFSDYKEIIDPDLYNEVIDLAKQLKGKRILEVNATANGGGVAEILRSQMALEQDLGLDAHWQVIRGNDAFFQVTKMLHNALQGDKLAPTAEQWQIYEDLNKQLAAALKDEWDYILIHDPQPAAIRTFLKDSQAKWAWRCHIDTSFPNAEVGERIGGYVSGYDGAIFTMDQYILPQLRGTQAAKNLAIIPVAIDPLSDKNQAMQPAEALKLVTEAGIDTKRPFITQISRFDPWKDPIGVIEAWEQARKHVSDLQLVLMGEMADDDPEGAKIYELVKTATMGLDGVHLITKSDVKLVHALQQTSNVVLQKSLREGFGLTVSEALWAGRPVIGGDVGGIPMQIENGRTGYLVDDVEDAAKAIVKLVQNPGMADKMGRAGREQVREHFLLPRLLRDQLKFWIDLG